MAAVQNFNAFFFFFFFLAAKIIETLASGIWNFSKETDQKQINKLCTKYNDVNGGQGGGGAKHGITSDKFNNKLLQKNNKNVFEGPKSLEKDLRVYEFCCICSLFRTLHSCYAVENTHVFLRFFSHLPTKTNPHRFLQCLKRDISSNVLKRLETVWNWTWYQCLYTRSSTKIK
jgi:hypothetical protein